MSQNVPQIVQKPHVPIENGQLKPRDFDGLYRVAVIMSKSGLVPDSYNNLPDKIFVAVQMGMELGLSPMASLQNIAVINGNPSLWGDAVLGIISGSGLLEDFTEEEAGTFPNNDYRFICTAKRKGRTTLISREFSIADAKQAGLFGSKKDNWIKYPKRMLQMRARSRTLRDGFPDLLKGIKVAEEAMDYDYDITPVNDAKTSVSERLNENADMKIYEVGKPKQQKQTLSKKLQDDIQSTLKIDENISKKALIEIGRDTVENITDKETAKRYLKKFNELIALSDDK